MTSPRPWILAIDFGTTATVAASAVEGRPPEVIELDGERRTPSVVVVDRGGSLLVGAAAEHVAASRPAAALRAPKRLLGEPRPVVLDGRPMAVVDLVGELLRAVAEGAARHHGGPPQEVRLTHPATWGRTRIAAMADAASRAGLDEPTFVAEPVAAAVAYAAEQGVPDGAHVVVYDLGGGTFDVAALRNEGGEFTVVGRPIGDATVGGELFDELLAHHVAEQLPAAEYEALQVDDSEPWQQAAAALRIEARRAKEALSSASEVEVAVALPVGARRVRVERSDLERLVAPHVEQSIDLLLQCIVDSGLAGTIHAVQLVGGPSRMPIVERLVSQAVPGVAVQRRGDPKTAVALGAVMMRHATPITAPASPVPASGADATVAPPPDATVAASPATPVPPATVATPPDPTVATPAGATVASPAAATIAAASATVATGPAPAAPAAPAAPGAPAAPAAPVPPPVPSPETAGDRGRGRRALVAAGIVAALAVAGGAIALASRGDDTVVAGPATTDPAATAVTDPEAGAPTTATADGITVATTAGAPAPETPVTAPPVSAPATTAPSATTVAAAGVPTAPAPTAPPAPPPTAATTAAPAPTAPPTTAAPPPTPATTAAPPTTAPPAPPTTAPVPAPTVALDGPTAITQGVRAQWTVRHSGATRGTWTLTGPLQPSNPNWTPASTGFAGTWGTTGTFTLTLTVQNDAGASASASVTFTVFGAPSAVIDGPDVIAAGQPAQWSVRSSNAVSGRWSLSGPVQPVNPAWSPGDGFGGTWNTPGTFTLTLTVQNQAGATAVATRTITVV